jgi:uncharacterized protein (UPF0333 family)
MKGQAAMEYLMTYGWAILVIVIVLGILYVYLTQFSKAPTSCLFAEQGFSCAEKPLIYTVSTANDVDIAVRLHNNQNDNIQIVKVLCTTGQPQLAKSDDGQAPSELLAPAVGSVVTSGTYVDLTNIKCKKADGKSNVQLAKGSDFHGTLIVWYTFEGGVTVPGVTPQARATVSGQVLEKS